MPTETQSEAADSYINIRIKASLIDRAYRLNEPDPAVTIGQILNTAAEIGLNHLESREQVILNPLTRAELYPINCNDKAQESAE